MTVKKVSNLAASVQARLQNHARAAKRPFQELLQYYAMERFLYRLATSAHRARFVLKGALMLHVWAAPLARATKDLDFLGRLDNSLANLERVTREVCSAEVEPDGSAGHQVSGAARLPGARALGLPARDRDRREVPRNGLSAHIEQSHEGFLRCVATREAVRFRRSAAALACAGNAFQPSTPCDGRWTREIRDLFDGHCIASR